MLPNGDEEVLEEETRITDEIVEHPTRDDWHEQRERGQICEAVLAAHSSVVTIQVVTTSRSTKRWP